MASTTPNLGLNKPDRTDFVNVITDINDNMDTLDTAIHQMDLGKASKNVEINGKALTANITIGQPVQVTGNNYKFVMTGVN